MITINNKNILAAEHTTIAEWEENHYHDSYFYARYFNVETGEIKNIEYDATAHGGYGSAKVDTTREKVQQFLALENVKTRQLQEALNAARNAATKIQKGAKVEVVKGRKVAKGTKGVIFWTKTCNYDRYNRPMNEVTKIGIKDAEGNVYWSYAHNVQVIPETVNAQEVIKKLKQKRSKAYKAKTVF